MAERRPLVNIGGRVRELPHSDTLPSSGGNKVFPFYIQSGASHIPLLGNAALPFTLSDGTQSNIQVIA